MFFFSLTHESNIFRDHDGWARSWRRSTQQPRHSGGEEGSARKFARALGAWLPWVASAPRTHLTLVYNLADMIKWQVDGLQVVCLTVTQLLLGRELRSSLATSSPPTFCQRPFLFCASLSSSQKGSDHQSMMGPTRWHLRPLRPRS